MSVAELKSLIDTYVAQGPKGLDRIQDEINDAVVANKNDKANRLTDLHTAVSDRAVQCGRIKLLQLNESTAVNTAATQLAAITKDMKDIIDRTKKAADVLATLTAALGLLKTAGDSIEAAKKAA